MIDYMRRIYVAVTAVVLDDQANAFGAEQHKQQAVLWRGPSRLIPPPHQTKPYQSDVHVHNRTAPGARRREGRRGLGFRREGRHELLQALYHLGRPGVPKLVKEHVEGG